MMVESKYQRLTDCLQTDLISLLGFFCAEQVMDGMMEEEDGEGEVVMVGLEPADLDEDAVGPVCYTELKPSTTLLVPLELAPEHQELLDGGTVEALGDEPEEALPGSSSSFSLMLDADVEEDPLPSELDPNDHLVLFQNAEQPEDMKSQPVTDLNVLCIEFTEQTPDDRAEENEAVAEPVVVSPPDVEQHLDKPEAQPEVIQEDLMQELIGSAEEHAPHSHPNEGRENGDIKDSASEGVEDDAHQEEGPEEIIPERNVSHKRLAVEAEELLIAGKEVEVCLERLDKASSHRAVEHKDLSGEQPEPPSRDDAEKEKAEERTKTLKEVQRSPARRSRKTVTFPVSVTESEKDFSDEEQTESMVPSTPRRVTRSCKELQDFHVPVTPRRSGRKVEPELPNDAETSAVKPSKPSSPSRTPQKATPRKGSRRTRNTNVSSDEEAPPTEESAVNNTTATQVRQSTRKTQKTSAHVPEPHPEVPEEEPSEQPSKAPASPSRVTRRSSRGVSLALESFQKDSAEDAVAQSQPVVTPPRSRRKTRAGTAEKTTITFTVDDDHLQKVSRRLTRSRLWSHEEGPKKEHLVSEAPLDVESTGPLGNALMDRLTNEGAEEESGGAMVTEIVRARRRTTRSAAPSTGSDNQSVSVEGSAEETQEPAKKPKASVRRTRASKLLEPSSPVRDSFTFTSSLQKTGGGSPRLSESLLFKSDVGCKCCLF